MMVSRLAVPPRPVRRPISGRSRTIAARYGSSSGGGFRFQPTSFSGARMVIRTEAGGPAATTRSTRSGTSTWRPAESTTRRPALADTHQIVVSSPTHSSRRPAAGALGAGAASFAHQLAHGAEFLLRRGQRDILDGPVEFDDAFAHGRDGGASEIGRASCRERV